ncbi:MAG: DUF411 domain-containing protein [Alphaproteobacteria bacterium]
MVRKALSLLFGLALVVSALPTQATAAQMSAVMYKNPDCACCEGYANYLRKNGYSVAIKEVADLRGFNKKQGIPDALEGCHTMFVNGYIIEGHVPLNAIQKLLTERPKIRGISIPGMPTGVPGMEGPREHPIAIYEIADGATKPKVFMTLR